MSATKTNKTAQLVTKKLLEDFGWFIYLVSDSVNICSTFTISCLLFLPVLKSRFLSCIMLLFFGWLFSPSPKCSGPLAMFWLQKSAVSGHPSGFYHLLPAQREAPKLLPPFQSDNLPSRASSVSSCWCRFTCSPVLSPWSPVLPSR